MEKKPTLVMLLSAHPMGSDADGDGNSHLFWGTGPKGDVRVLGQPPALVFSSWWEFLQLLRQTVAFTTVFYNF